MRRFSVGFISESSKDCDNWYVAVSLGVSIGNWTTVSALYVDKGSLIILVGKSCKSGHSKVCTTRLVGGDLLEASVWF